MAVVMITIRPELVILRHPPVYMTERSSRHIGTGHSCVDQMRDILVPLLCVICVRGCVTELCDPPVCILLVVQKSIFLSPHIYGIGSSRATTQLA